MNALEKNFRNWCVRGGSGLNPYDCPRPLLVCVSPYLLVDGYVKSTNRPQDREPLLAALGTEPVPVHVGKLAGLSRHEAKGGNWLS